MIEKAFSAEDYIIRRQLDFLLTSIFCLVMPVDFIMMNLINLRVCVRRSVGPAFVIVASDKHRTTNSLQELVFLIHESSGPK